MKVGLITGITGQDGSYLSELLLKKGYEVWGICRRSSSSNTMRINHIIDKLNLRYGDLSDSICINNILTEITDKYGDDLIVLEVYNLGAMSHVKVSFDIPEYCSDIDGTGVLRLLECIKNNKYKDKIRFYQASTSELYGLAQNIPQTENTPFYPRSPYACAKLYGYWITINYRESFNIYACNGILFNHESPRRGDTFVTKKITSGVCNIKKGKQDYITMGNIYSKRDWGHAKDFVYGMWLMLQQDKPVDYVLSTGKHYSIKEFIEMSFEYVNINIKWKGEGLDEIGYDEDTGKTLIVIDSKYFRPTEVDTLLGDSTKAMLELGWKYKYDIKGIIKEMIDT